MVAYENGINYIYFSQIIRITILISLALPIPLTLRLLIIYIADSLDHNQIVRIFWPNLGKTTFYQTNDKIVDIISYIVIMLYFYKNFGNNPLIYLLLGFLIYRMVGVYKFIKTGDEKILRYYPDLFREFSIYMALIYDGYLLDKLSYNIIAIIAIIIIKILVEYDMH